MLVSMKEMLLKAKEGKYAVGHFNINNLEWTKSILKVAEEMKSPVILGVSEGAARYMTGYKAVAGMVKGMLEDMNITVDVALHLDHGSTFEACKKAIDAGFSSVMIDASKYEFDKNMEITKQVVDYAHERGISVEAELGHVGGQEDDVQDHGILYADKEECVKMLELTKIDCLAPALGSVHGPYHGEPKLGFKEMKEIQEATGLPLVLHGGSGIPDEQIKKAISYGTCKINVNTESQQEFNKILREFIADKKNKDVYDPRKLITPATAGIEKVVREKIKLFGSEGKASK